jgi:hypothetical protein
MIWNDGWEGLVRKERSFCIAGKVGCWSEVEVGEK